MSNIEIRETTSDDTAQVLELYQQAFPDEDLCSVVSGVLSGGHAALSLAAYDKNLLVAHLLFSVCATDTQDKTGALLGPLGVLPSYQKQGLGGKIINAGLENLAKGAIKQVFVLGAPAYYQRFGFSTERQVLAPYPIPEKWAEVWQSMSIASRSSLDAGPLLLPAPWMEPALWGP